MNLRRVAMAAVAFLLPSFQAGAVGTAPKAKSEGNLALARYYGIGQPQDFGRAFGSAAAGAAIGDPVSIVVKALCVGRGRGAPQDVGGAMTSLKPLLEKRDPFACAAAAVIMGAGRWGDETMPVALAQEFREEYAAIPLYNRAERTELARIALVGLQPRASTDAVACIVSGQLFAWGAGVKVDEAKALELFERAWSLGCSDAANQIALIFQQGAPERRDHAKALDWFRKAAEAGNAVAQSNLVQFGDFKGADPARKRERRELLTASARAGYPPAMAQLSREFWPGTSDATAIAEARTWLEKATTGGERGAGSELGILLLQTSKSETDRQRAIQLLRTAAARGCEVGAFHLSTHFITGPDLSPNRVAAALLLASFAADAGVADAWGTLGLAWENGRVGQPNIAKARECWEKGTALDSAYCEYLLGHSLATAEGPLRDLTRAFDLTQKSAQHRHLPAMTETGRCLLIGSGVEKNIGKGVEWLRQAIAQGDTDAPVMLGAQYLHGLDGPPGVEEGLRILKAAADTGNCGAIVELAATYQGGIGVARDDAEGARWLRKGVEFGDAKSTYHLARALEDGVGVSRDAAEAWRLLNCAAELKHGPACARIADWYREGRRGQPSPADAVAWYQKAADLGDPLGMNNLGYSYQIGAGVAADPTRAIELYLRSAALGESLALINLAICHERGIGVAVDLEKARTYRQRAAEQKAANEDRR